MKTAEQILGFIQGWQCAIRSREGDLSKDDVYQALITIESYIKKESE